MSPFKNGLGFNIIPAVDISLCSGWLSFRAVKRAHEGCFIGAILKLLDEIIDEDKSMEGVG